MVERWFSREFIFALPLPLYPNILERLRGTPARLEDRLLLLPLEILTFKEEEQWSIQEHAGHLLDLGSLDFGRLEDFAAGLDTLRAADLTNKKTFEANHNSNSIQGILKSFRSEREALVTQLESFDESFVQRTALHPRLKQRLRVIDLCYFIAEHDDHHLAKISAVLRNRQDAR